jgi:CheY-like chemotaxis protein
MMTSPVVLYVEDDPNSRKIMRVLLTKYLGLSDITIFEDSTDFSVRVAALNPKPTVIFLDIHVKPYDGFEMLGMLRQSDAFHDTPIVALTASVMNEEVYRLQTAGFHSVIPKPLDISSFPNTFKRILSGQHIWSIVA